ncbi:aluminum-activated malate transporter 1-like [Typha angustifolia]|uniref:aluminum-activated malate transporter 1-like n=1 Tax=Typha angustifolia TaxID=59011 RepID=UPI003C2F2C6F
MELGISPWPSSLCSSVLDKLKASARKVRKIGEDDPRRIAHSFKVGLALTAVSFFYYATPLYDGFGVSAIWAVMTVVVVMEYTVGATLSKGLNRAVATLIAGVLGVGAHEVAARSGERGEPIVLGLFVFVLGAASTFSRFVPAIKARYDYGVTIFILTFSLVAVSSFRVEELLQLAHQRLSTVAIGVAICLATSFFVFPVWAGEELHKLVASNLEKLASFLEGLEAECFGEKARQQNMEGKPFLQVHKSVLNSKASEDSLLNFAKWEPRHGRFGCHHPWKQYQKLGALNRHCASSMESLVSFITTFREPMSKNTDPDIAEKIRTSCVEMSSGSAKALRELSTAIRAMTVPHSANGHVAASLAASADLRRALSGGVALSEVTDIAAISFLLAEIVGRTEEIAGSVEELARLAMFKPVEPDCGSAVKPVADDEETTTRVAITIDR